MPISVASVKGFLENPVFLAPVTSWFFAQLIKTLIFLAKPRKKRAREILESLTWRTGGMPSSHSALVTSMAATVGVKEGIDSTMFIMSLWLVMIVIRDALGVRRASGVQARGLNLLGRNVAEKTGIEYHPVKEVHGHTPLEVAVGGFLGIFIAAAYAFL
jgi:acid phosphatase family membrane protein YuiD